MSLSGLAQFQFRTLAAMFSNFKLRWGYSVRSVRFSIWFDRCSGRVSPGTYPPAKEARNPGSTLPPAGRPAAAPAG
eukprot:15275083-Alexandrium_andersonii.AAC.1